MLDVAPDVDVIFVPVGAGSGVLGAGVVARALNPSIRVIGVQSEGAPAVFRSWRDGTRVVTENVNTFAEGLATRAPFEMPLALFPRFVDEIMLVSDDQLADGIRLLIRTTRQVAEAAGAAATAAAMLRRNELAGKNVGLILSGGNITIEQLSRILNNQALSDNFGMSALESQDLNFRCFLQGDEIRRGDSIHSGSPNSDEA
jgi:threonine dehydratase